MSEVFEAAVKAIEQANAGDTGAVEAYNRAEAEWQKVQKAYEAWRGPRDKGEKLIQIVKQYGPAVAKYFGLPVSVGMIESATGVFKPLLQALGIL